ncbi:aminotransferase class-III-domain-containing protein [Kockiozyma suomiensis]|uniref:aminotransferase class-III-domain-containing protein n=1 Tax=Kockiozyma suomiensis TaxID=1337062 RepID=UPI0033436434
MPTASSNSHSPSAAYFPDEPELPRLVTSFPGPASAKYLKSLGEIFDTKAAYMLCDYQKSIGNYLCDADGNLYLDVYAQIASIALGYNNPALIEIAKSPEMIDAIVNRPALGNFPSIQWEGILREGLLSVAPHGLDKIWTSLAGSDANEAAYKAAFIYHRLRQRGKNAKFSDAEMESTMNNSAPGSPDLAILSFEKAFHGRLFGSLSTTRSNPIHKLDIPAFKWPKAPFPTLKYPLDQNEEYNRKEEDDCLTELEIIIKDWDDRISAVVVEPIQSEGGDNHATPYFFQQLREITKKNNILLIIDEVQTGVAASGTFWAHEQWNLSTPPDMVTFSKKFQAAGFFYGNDELRPQQPFRQFNTWCGDPSKALIARGIVKEIKEKNLVSQVARVGEYLYDALSSLQDKHPDKISNLRGKGRGTFIAWDAPNLAARNKFLLDMKAAGINIGGCGLHSVRLRPSMCDFLRFTYLMMLMTLNSTFI